MQAPTEQKPTTFVDATTFVDRRTPSSDEQTKGPERRQFRDARLGARPEVVELGEAIDQYKLRHRRRFITFEELFDVMTELGYHK